MIKNFHIGELKQIVDFKTNSPTAKGAGYKDSYSTLLTTRGRLRKKSGTRTLSFGAILDSHSYELVVRYQTTIENNIRTDMKIEVDGKTFTINSFDKVGEKQFYYVFDLSLQTI